MDVTFVDLRTKRTSGETKLEARAVLHYTTTLNLMVLYIYIYTFNLYQTMAAPVIWTLHYVGHIVILYSISCSDQQSLLKKTKTLFS